MSDGIVRYFETDGFGHKLRSLYIIDGRELPPALAGTEWRFDAEFDRANALIADSNLSHVFREVLRSGAAFVS